MMRQSGSQRAAFSNYDPTTANGNGFDPNVANRYNGVNGADVVSAKEGQKMQVNLTLSNPTAVELTFEMFNYLESMTRKRNATYVPLADTNYAYIPMTSYEGLLKTLPVGTANAGGIVGFDQGGDLIIRGDDSGMAADPVGRITCSESSYAGWFEASAIAPFQVAYIRETVTTDSQIDKQIVWFRKTFSGAEVLNKVNPRAYFRPNQFQPKTIDVTVELTIGIDSGIRMNLLPAETVTLSFFLNAWTLQALGQ
jgi:hypothetical protein